MAKGSIGVTTSNIFPVIKQFLPDFIIASPKLEI